MRYLNQSGDYTSGLALAERFIEQWTKDSGPDSSDVLRAQRHLGNLLRNLGRYEESYRAHERGLGQGAGRPRGSRPDDALAAHRVRGRPAGPR